MSNKSDWNEYLNSEIRSYLDAGTLNAHYLSLTEPNAEIHYFPVEPSSK